MLAKVKIYKGIEFIELNDLSLEHADLFKEWAPREAFIKILMKDQTITDCIQYKFYRNWYKVAFGVKHSVPLAVAIDKQLINREV